MSRKILLVATLLLWHSPLLAGVFTAELDKTVGPIDEPFVLIFTVSGDHDEEPTLPDIKDLRITGAGTSSNFTIINGNASRSTTYRFLIQPMKEGSYEIPSVTLKVDGAQQQSAPLKFRVEPAGSTTEGPAVAFVRRELSANKVYLGEPIIAKIKIYFREKLAQVQNETEPSTDFRVFKSEDQRTYTEEVDGVSYRVHELTEVLVPTKTGKLNLNPYVLEAHVQDRSRNRGRRRGPGSLFEDFFGGSLGGGNYKRKVLRTEAQVVEVQPVPQRDQPKDFSGLVGSFQLDATLANTQVKTGETVTLTVTVRGQGMVDQLEQLQLNLPDKMKVYTDKPITEQVIDDEKGFLSRKVFKFALVPTEPGTYDLPPVSLRVFVPKLGSFVELSEELPQLTVTGERESIGVAGDSGARKQRVKKLAEDLVHIHRGDRLLNQHRLVQADYWLLTTVSGLPTLALFVGWFWRRRKGQVNPLADQQKRRSQAYRRLAADLKQPESSSDVFTSFRGYLGDVLGIKGGTVTEKDACTQLGTRGVSAPLLEELRSLWSRLARAEYGGAVLGAAELAELRDAILKLAKEIDQQC